MSNSLDIYCCILIVSLKAEPVCTLIKLPIFEKTEDAIGNKVLLNKPAMVKINGPIPPIESTKSVTLPIN
jgi:hypothetical protein